MAASGESPPAATPPDGGNKREDEEEGNDYVRWLAYLARVKAIALRTTATISLKAGPARYMAFTSDVGEAFRPAVASWIVNTSYGISVAYIGGTIVEAGLGAKRSGGDARHIAEHVAEEATFQFLASLLLPFLVIHTAVHRTAVFLKRREIHLTRPLVAKWAPSAVGLGCIPILPVAVDKPCEHAVEAFFDKVVRKKEHSWAADEFHKQHKDSMGLKTLFGKFRKSE